MTATATQRRATRPVLAAVPPSSPREFPVRFTQTPGLRSLLQRPHNSYGWVGIGSILIDQHSLRITARRFTMLGLRRTVDFVHQSEIREVYREGDAIRVDLLDEARRSYFCFWAEDAGSAAEIVGRLPTNSTVEIEWVGRKAWEDPPPRLPQPVLWTAASIVLIAVLIWLGETFIPPAPPKSRTSSAPPPMPMHVPGALPAVADFGALADLDKFTRRFDALVLEISVASDSLQAGALNQAEFAHSLEQSLIPQWNTLSAELAAPPTAVTPLRADADALLQHVIDSWTRALSLYVQGLRNHDHREVLRAFDYIRDAEGYERESHALLSQLEANR